MGRLFLSPTDCRIANEWRHGDPRVLRDVQPKEYREPTGQVIIVSCSDGHQCLDILSFQARHTAHGHVPMVHPLSLNGGVLLLAPNTPLLQPGEADHLVLFKHIGAAHQIKGTPTVLLYGHAPCKAAYNLGLDLERVAELFFAAKAEVKKLFPHLQVVPKFHIDWAAKEDDLSEKRSYFIDRREFETWRQHAA